MLDVGGVLAFDDIGYPPVQKVGLGLGLGLGLRLPTYGAPACQGHPPSPLAATHPDSPSSRELRDRSPVQP